MDQTSYDTHTHTRESALWNTTWPPLLCCDWLSEVYRVLKPFLMTSCRPNSSLNCTRLHVIHPSISNTLLKFFFCYFLGVFGAGKSFLLAVVVLYLVELFKANDALNQQWWDWFTYLVKDRNEWMLHCSYPLSKRKPWYQHMHILGRSIHSYCRLHLSSVHSRYLRIVTNSCVK